MGWLQGAFHFITDIDGTLNHAVREMGQWWSYGIMFASIFAETGFIVTPFFPGEALIFTAAAMAAAPHPKLNPFWIGFFSVVAAIAGDVVNYSVARRWGHRLFRRSTGRIFTHQQKEAARWYFKHYGGKTLIFARYIPLIRDAAPFMAGVGQMPAGEAITYIAIGATIWVAAFVAAGFFLGQMPFFDRNFHYMVLIIAAVALLPALVGWARVHFGHAERKRRKAA